MSEKVQGKQMSQYKEGITKSGFNKFDVTSERGNNNLLLVNENLNS